MLSNCNNPAKVLIVDDQAIVRAGLKAIIAEESAMAVCGECETAEQALAATCALQPDIVIVELMLGKSSTAPLIAALKAGHPSLRVLVLSGHDEAICAPRTIAAGAHGYVMKDAGIPALRDAIRTVLSGEQYLGKQVRAELPDGFARGARPSGYPGLGAAQFAAQIGCSPATLAGHYSNMRGGMTPSVGNANGWPLAPVLG